ncbi:MAG TPA: LamG domain-containing protein, partial [Armatimonadetes bacterium]|nr:LamG domain-containing protein [Armatimonadota bacterium]
MVFVKSFRGRRTHCEIACCCVSHVRFHRGPVAWWGFDEGRGSVAHDLVGGHHGKILGAKWAKGRVRGALLFDGDDVVVVHDSPDLRLEGPISVEAWIKPFEISSWHMIVRKEREYQLRINPPKEGKFSAFFVFLSGRWEPRVHGPVPEPGRWHHIVGVWTGEKLQIWLDGELTSRIRRGRPRATRNPVYIGSGFVGLIDEVRIYRRALRWEEIFARFKGLPVPTGKPSEPFFDFDKGLGGWFSVKGVEDFSARGGVLRMRTTSSPPLISSPPLRARAEDFDFLSIRMRVERGMRSEVRVTTERGTDSIPFDLLPDGRWHTYNIEAVASPIWEGR